MSAAGTSRQAAFLEPAVAFGAKRTCKWLFGATISFAVGTVIAHRPPHRSAQAGFPHAAPTSGIWRRTCRTHSSACDTRYPVLRPVCALLARVPLGPRPWLHRLRCQLPGFVRRLRCYYGEVRLLTAVCHRLGNRATDGTNKENCSRN